MEDVHKSAVAALIQLAVSTVILTLIVGGIWLLVATLTQTPAPTLWSCLGVGAAAAVVLRFLYKAFIG